MVHAILNKWHHLSVQLFKLVHFITVRYIWYKTKGKTKLYILLSFWDIRTQNSPFWNIDYRWIKISLVIFWKPQSPTYVYVQWVAHFWWVIDWSNLKSLRTCMDMLFWVDSATFMVTKASHLLYIEPQKSFYFYDSCY